VHVIVSLVGARESSKQSNRHAMLSGKGLQTGEWLALQKLPCDEPVTKPLVAT